MCHLGSTLLDTIIFSYQIVSILRTIILLIVKILVRNQDLIHKIRYSYLEEAQGVLTLIKLSSLLEAVQQNRRGLSSGSKDSPRRLLASAALSFLIFMNGALYDR